MARMLGGESLEPHELEILVERPDGLRRNVLAHPLALKNERGEIIGAINCLYDITERKQAEEKIIFQANLLGAVGSAVIATDLNGIVLYWNPAAEKLYGWSSSDALGRNIVDVAPAPQSQEQAGEIMKQLGEREIMERGFPRTTEGWKHVPGLRVRFADPGFQWKTGGHYWRLKRYHRPQTG